MSDFAHQAEVEKFALLLNLAPAQLPYLYKLKLQTLRQLREQTTAALFDADAELFGRIAASTRLLPTLIAAVIAEKALGPLLCARVAGLLPPQRAADIAKRLSSDFLADVCVNINPQQIRELIALMPIARIIDVAQTMIRRKDYIIMARFVDCLDQATMRKVIDALDDDEALLRIGFYVEEPQQLDPVIMLFPDLRLRNMIVSAIEQGAELWSEALALIHAIGAQPRQRMITLTAALEDSSLLCCIALTDQQQLWSQIHPLLKAWSDDQVERLCAAVQADQPALAPRLLQALEDALHPSPPEARIDK